MTKISAIAPDASVDDIMTRFPQTIPVFLRYRMSCVGCLMGPFHTVADAAEEYALELDAFLGELRDAVVTPAV